MLLARKTRHIPLGLGPIHWFRGRRNPEAAEIEQALSGLNRSHWNGGSHPVLCRSSIPPNPPTDFSNFFSGLQSIENNIHPMKSVPKLNPPLARTDAIQRPDNDSLRHQPELPADATTTSPAHAPRCRKKGSLPFEPNKSKSHHRANSKKERRPQRLPATPTTLKPTPAASSRLSTSCTLGKAVELLPDAAHNAFGSGPLG